jgi:membrane dipeptidase
MVDEPIRFLDGHNDTLLRLYRGGTPPIDEFLAGGAVGHLDIRRCLAGGWAGGFFAVFVPEAGEDSLSAHRPDPPYSRPLDAPVDPAYARGVADEIVDLLLEVEARSDGRVAVARSVEALEHALAGGPIAAILHFEGAEPIDAGLESLEAYHDRGLRSLGIVWSRPNAFAEGVPFEFPAGPDTGAGLTEAGERLVRKCNRLGIMLDLSHLNERGFWDVADRSEAPLVASHSNAHALCAIPRNLTDAQLDEIGRSGGLVGLTVHSGMLRADGRVDPATPLDRFLDHVDYVVARIGIDHAAFGSDFDGAAVIEDVADAAKLQRILEGLRKRGYAEDDLRKFAHENWLRVLRATWRT